ncbi:MAG: PolC-type DNA polymerase III, partial [Clostridiales bacterium]|nr:PolC-type DNA polymerase III [Clostridiales bacterium]
MSRSFKEVFAGLNLDGQLSDLMDTAEVTRVCTNRSHSHLRIYLRGHRLIFKKNIWKLEREIKNQLFAGQDVDVTVIESFELSAQYNARNFYEEYKTSMQDELNAHSSLEYNLLRMADVDFEEDRRIVLTLEDTPIAHSKSDDLVEYLEKVFCERGGMDMIIKVAYKEHKESKFRSNCEFQMQREVENIVARTKLGEQQRQKDIQAEKEAFLGEGKTSSYAADEAGIRIQGSAGTSRTGKSRTDGSERSNIRSNAAGADGRI